LERAKSLLAGTDLPMPEIARSSGFTEGKHLSVVFRQETGMTPTAYRRLMRGGAK
jgi:transcriptional regulator GlxA family with amidase domain